MAAPNTKQGGRAFSLFSVVTFPNDECTTTMDPTMRGLCITSEECTDQGGTASGNCASGFGVCCFTIVTDPGTITNNVTYIQNEGFPTAVLGVAPVVLTPRAFPIEGGANICQVRFDFEAPTVLAGPLNGALGAAVAVVGGTCDNDQITVTQTSTGGIGNGFENLCGVLTGQHIYVENDGANPAATLNINTDAFILARTWKILVRTIECDSPSKAPGGCLQYHTGASGNFQSFNNGPNGALIDNLIYSICIRREKGMCSYTVREARSAAGAVDAFQVGSVPFAAAGVADGLRGLLACNVAMGGAWLVIPNAQVQDPEYCGGLLTQTTLEIAASPVTGTGPIRVVTLPANQGLVGTGFDLVYSQTACN